jgi:hypothetical protein
MTSATSDEITDTKPFAHFVWLSTFSWPDFLLVLDRELGWQLSFCK